jgi:hypothetical protein
MQGTPLLRFMILPDSSVNHVGRYTTFELHVCTVPAAEALRQEHSHGGGSMKLFCENNLKMGGET